MKKRNILIVICIMLLAGLGFLLFYLKGVLPKNEEELAYMTKNIEIKEVNGIAIQHEYIPRSSKRRPNEKREIMYITLHETDNRKQDANAKAHQSFLANNTSDVTSWHYTVDDHSIYHHIPDNEISWNAGDRSVIPGGNMNGIGIEMCVNVDNDYEATLKNTADLVAHLLYNYNLSLEDIKLHQDFMNKVCPHRLITEGRVDEFKKMVAHDFEQLQESKTEEGE